MEDADFARSWTLLVSSAGRPIAELVFADNRLARVDYQTQDEVQRGAFQRRLDAVMLEARRDGLRVKFHGVGSTPGERGALMGAQPKPGGAYFTLAMREHLGDATFKISVK